MLGFTKFEGPFGIPIYYEQLPALVKNSAMAIAVWVGAKNDTSVGEPGLYHWFEHVPFRGTTSFPNGYDSTFGTISRLGGNLNAYTSFDKTVYLTHVPTRFLRTGFNVVTDLVARPLLSNEGIDAEREIIKQEITRGLSSIERVASLLGRKMWNGHPLSNDVLGTAESLEAMNTSTLLEARKKGYDRSRMALFVSTSEGISTILKWCEDLFKLLPDNGLKARVKPDTIEEVTWPKEKIFETQTSFETSILRIIYPLPIPRSMEENALFTLVANVIGYGGPGSPLYRTIREEMRLAYEVGSFVADYSEAYALGMHTKIAKKNIPSAINEWHKMLREDEQLRSKNWFDSIKESRKYKLEMETIHPMGRVENEINKVVDVGHVFTNEEYIDIIDSINHDKVMEVVLGFCNRDPYIVSVLGK